MTNDKDINGKLLTDEDLQKLDCMAKRCIMPPYAFLSLVSSKLGKTLRKFYQYFTYLPSSK